MTNEERLEKLRELRETLGNKAYECTVEASKLEREVKNIDKHIARLADKTEKEQELDALFVKYS